MNLQCQFGPDLYLAPNLAGYRNRAMSITPKSQDQPFAGQQRSERGVATVSCAADGEKRSALTSAVVGTDCAGDAIEPDCVAVRDDPLRSGVSEWHSDTDHRFGVIAGDLLDDGVALNCAKSSAFIRYRDG